MNTRSSRLPLLAIAATLGIGLAKDPLTEAIEEIKDNTKPPPPPPPTRSRGNLTDEQIRDMREHAERCRKGQRAKFRKGKR